MLIFISGLPGSGKSTIGSMVAEKLGWTFVEADQFLSQKMRSDINSGIPVDFKDLDSWVIDGVIAHLKILGAKENIVVSGMLEQPKYRELLLKCRPDTVYINLEVPYSVLKERVNKRNHFAGIKSLDLCWEIKDRFKLPGPTVNGSLETENVVNDIISIVKSTNENN